MSSITIRHAGPSDAAVLPGLCRQAFSDAFGHLYPPEDLAAFLDEAYAPSMIAAELVDQATSVWLAEEGQAAIGYAVGGPCTLPHAEVTPACAELKRLYVLRSHQGTGLGTRLLNLALKRLQADGARRLWLGVWSENFRAQALYARHGFTKVGEYGFRVGATVDREFIFRRDQM
jgi:ribosomal protein S18 acetylase RimI-like enzyme